MKQKIKLSETSLVNIINESVLAELDRRKVMPSKYYEIFKNRVINAIHGNFGDVERVVKEFYRDFKDRIPNADFTLDNLMELAENIDGDGGITHEKGGSIGGHKIKDADGWWGANMGKFLEEGKVLVTESQLCKLIKESVMKALVNEISSDMISRARDKFIRKYGNNFMGQETPGEMDQNLETDRFNRKLHPKDKKPLAWHQADFDRAYEKAKMDENPELIEKAKELVRKVKDWSVEEITDRIDSYSAEANVYGEVQDKNGEWWGFWAGGTVDCGEVVDVAYNEDIKFEAPNGFTGWC